MARLRGGEEHFSNALMCLYLFAFEVPLGLQKLAEDREDLEAIYPGLDLSDPQSHAPSGQSSPLHRSRSHAEEIRAGSFPKCPVVSLESQFPSV